MERSVIFAIFFCKYTNITIKKKNLRVTFMFGECGSRALSETKWVGGHCRRSTGQRFPVRLPQGRTKHPHPERVPRPAAGYSQGKSVLSERWCCHPWRLHGNQSWAHEPALSTSPHPFQANVSINGGLICPRSAGQASGNSWRPIELDQKHPG